jgi:Arc/MetJ family transcription regulator
MEALMSKTLIDLDDEALADAAKLFGTTTKKDTVNAALREAAQRLRRREAFDRLAGMAEAGDFDVLLDKRNYRR